MCLPPNLQACVGYVAIGGFELVRGSGQVRFPATLSRINRDFADRAGIVEIRVPASEPLAFTSTVPALVQRALSYSLKGDRECSKILPCYALPLRSSKLTPIRRSWPFLTTVSWTVSPGS